MSLLVLPAQAQSQTNAAAVPGLVPPIALLRASPKVIQPIGGKLPSSVTVAVLENCDDPNRLDLSNDKLLITGSGLSLSAQQNASKCVIQATLTVDPSTPAATYSLIVVDKTTGSPVGSTDISVLDTSAAGIPPGLAPEVDVIWGVMSQNNCSDVFGKRVAQSMYCVQLKIGNNSGHPLQIAGVGFAKTLQTLTALGIPQVTIANTSYSSTRAVLVESQVWSSRNLIYNTFASAGLIMAASSPFYAGPAPDQLSAKTRFLTLSTIVSGPLLQAFNILVPDPIVAQLKSLDDQSFRDNMIIPNNSQIQTVVFVEKQNLTIALRETLSRLLDAAHKARNVADTMKANRSADKTAQQNAANEAENLDKMAGQSKETVKNSTRPGGLKKKGSHDPLLVKLALGSVVVVGDEIQYLHRVQIQSSATTVTPPAISVVIVPKPASPTTHGSSTTFTATVQNDPANAGVTWSLSRSGADCTGTPSPCGTLSATSSASGVAITYKAPTDVPTPTAVVTLTATSKSDQTKSDSVTVTITIN